MDEIFDFHDYRKAFGHLIAHGDKGGRGAQTRLAKELGCQQAFLSRVLAGQAELGPEQSFGVAKFFNLSKLAREYWLALVAENRAGNAELKAYQREKCERLREEYQSLHRRIDTGNKINDADKAYYYGDWFYSALHMLVAVPAYAKEEVMAQKLGLALEDVHRCLEMLERAQLIERSGGSWKLSTGRIHLPPTHPLVRKHHANWRLFTMQKLSKPNTEDLHYTSVVSCGEKDKEKVRQILGDAVTKIRALIKDSPDEVVCHYAVDFLEL